MPLFRRGSDEDRQAREAAATRQAESLEALERGELPLGAQQRLTELAGGTASFTSDLTVNEFALARSTGLRPVGQVMGSSIYHVGWQQSPGMWAGWQAGGFSQELTVLSDAWNEARRRAFGRLQQEARLLAADAVIGVQLTRRGHDWAAGAIEYMAIGTAVRSEGAELGDAPVVTDLSGQAYWQLVEAGYRPLGVVGATSVHYVVSSWQQQQAQTGWASWSNQELGDFTQGVYDARETALGRVGHEARRQGATGMVGVSIDHSVEERAVNNRTNLVVTIHVLGTSLAGGDPASRQPSPTLTVDLSAGRRRAHLLGGSQ